MNGLMVLGLWAAVSAAIAVIAGWTPLAVWLQANEKLAAWAQAVGSIAAIAAGAAAVWWQVHRQASIQADQRRADEVQRLQIAGAGIFECRVAAFSIEYASQSSLSVESEVDELAAMLRSLSTIGPLDLPDWRAGYAINTAAIAFASVEARLRAVPVLKEVTHKNRMAYVNVIVGALEFAEGLIRECLVERGADVLPIRHIHNGTAVKSLSYNGPA